MTTRRPATANRPPPRTAPIFVFYEDEEDPVQECWSLAEAKDYVKAQGGPQELHYYWIVQGGRVHYLYASGIWQSR